MKRLLTALMTLMFMLTMTATPVLAKGGGGGSGSGGNGNSGSQAGGKSSISSSVKGDSTSKNAVNSNNGNKGVNSNNNTGNTQNTENLKTAKEKAQTALANKDISTTDSSDTTGHWASKSIKIAKSLGIVNGYPDGSFKPDNSVTNAEAVVIMVKMAELVGTDEQVTEVTIDQETTDENTTDNEAIDEDTSDQESTEETESDQMPAWAKESFKQAGAMGIVNLNRFHSQVQANRAQCAVMLAKALNLEPSFNDELPFSDVGYLSGEDLGYLVALQQAGIIAGSPGGKFNPNSSITRGEIAAMLAQVVEPDADETTDGTTTDGTTTDGTTTDGTTT